MLECVSFTHTHQVHIERGQNLGNLGNKRYKHSKINTLGVTQYGLQWVTWVT